jgi:hypothetical protein
VVTEISTEPSGAITYGSRFTTLLWPEGVVELRALDSLVFLIVRNSDLDGAAALSAIGIRRRELK